MGDETVRVRALISGRVQGVWFRQSTADAMTGNAVAGWVRNLDDGRVEAVFEGPRDSVSRALDYVSHGPERARVDGVETTWEEPTGLQGFRVR
jgi:acylphosphatase